LLVQQCTDSLIQIEKELEELIRNNSNNPENIAEIAPAFYEILTKKLFIVDKDCDEIDGIFKMWNDIDNSNNMYEITINPTMNCNLRCWYCYENHNAGSYMNVETLQSLITFIEKKAQKYKNISLSFFGGEPLLYFKKTVKPILDKIDSIRNQYQTIFHIHFTTNATLLTDDIINYLLPWTPSFQIALDGNEQFHNQVKTRGDSTKSTYSSIMKNIRLLLKNHIQVNIRCNYTAKSLPSFIDVLTDIKDWGMEEKHYANISLHRVWQDTSVPDTELLTLKTELEKHFSDAGFRVSYKTTNIIQRCYADKKNSIVINYDGSVFKCTARDFNDANKEGQLTNSGDVVWNDKYRIRIESMFQNKTCLDCNIFGICRGGCSQSKLENKRNDCIMNFSENDKIDFVQQRIIDINKMMSHIK